MSLTPTQFRQIIDLCTPRMQTISERQALFDRAFFNAPFRTQINWEGPAATFVQHLLSVLLKHRYNGEHPLRALLLELKADCSPDLHPQIEALLPLIDALLPDAMLPSQLPQTLFLSYSRADDEPLRSDPQ
ncbi:MAG: hypothetical protein SNJ58_13425 [Aggregatilineales bacterium]